MSTWQEIPESAGRFCNLGRRVPEKSNFSQTCSLLSQYLKNKGSLADLNFGMARNTSDGKGKAGAGRSTSIQIIMSNKMNSSTNADVITERDEIVTYPELKSMDLFPQHAGFGISFPTEEDLPKKNDTITRDEQPIMPMAESDPTTAPMTIFYAGKVFVFDNIPAEKANDLMLFACKHQGQFPNVNTCSASGDVQKVNNFGTGGSALGSNVIVTSEPGNDSKQECIRRPLQANASDLPIARRASLHRFLEKRKDRVVERSPYQLGLSAAAAPKPEESRSWLGLGSSS